jgi:hypothetical protein
MKRQGLHRPTIEDVVEISGIETLHPGGFPLTLREVGWRDRRAPVRARSATERVAGPSVSGSICSWRRITIASVPDRIVPPPWLP